MKWYNKVINGLTAGILLGSLLIPLDKGIASASTGVSWTKDPGEISFVPEQKNVTDASVIKDGSTYRMWYTHTTNDNSLLDLLSDATTVIPKTVVADLFSLNFPEFLNGLGSVNSANLWNLLTDSTGYSTTIGYATSTNGTSWTVVNSNAVTGSNGILGSVSAPSVIKEGDTSYKMWFTRNKTTLTQSSLQTILTNLGNPAQRNAAFSQIFQSFSTVIGYATSTDGSSWTLPTEVIAGSNGVMDSVSAPSVIKDGSTYKMWYSRMKTDVVQADRDALAVANATAVPLWNILDGTGSVIGYATSTDGISWGPLVNHPEALTAGAGFWDSVGSPSIIQGAGYEMWYTRGKTDFTVTKLNTLFTEAAKLVDPGWDLLTAYQTGNITALLNGMSAVNIVPIKGLLNETGTSIGYATSGNGASFTEQNPRNLTGASNATWASVASPGVIKDTAARLWYNRGIDDLNSQNLVDRLLGKETMGYAYFYFQPPSVVTDNATSVGQTIATLNGNLTSMGTASTVNVSFEYGLNTNYGSTINAATPSMTANGTFSAPLTGLAGNTTYHFRAKAVGDLTANGIDGNFTTQTIPPTVVTVKADSIGLNSADLYGNLTSMGTATTVGVSFDYGLDNTYGSTSNTTSMFAIGPFFAEPTVSGLTANTTYHFRAKAMGDGNVTGSDMTFTTLPPSVVVTPENSTIALYSGHVQFLPFKALLISTDNATQDVTSNANISWSSNNTAVVSFASNTNSTATISATATVGTALISATYSGFGGVTGTTTFGVLPDTISPVVTLNSPNNGITISTNSLNVTGMVDDTAANVTAIVNGDVGNATTLAVNATTGVFNQAITLRNGTNQIIILAADHASPANVGTSGTITVTVIPTLPGQPQRPTVTIISPVDGLLTNNSTLTVSGTVLNSTVVTVKVNELTQDGNVTNGNFSVTFADALKQNGMNIIVAYAYPANHTGEANYRGSSGIIQVDLDQTVPVVSIDSPVSGSTVSTAVVNVQGAIDDNRIDFANLTVNGGIIQTIQIGNNRSFSQDVLLSNGTNTIMVSAMDEAGNIGNTTTTVTLNTTKPVVKITSPANRFLTNSTSLTVNGTVDNPTINSVTLLVNSNSYTVPVNNGNFSQVVILANGTDTISATAQDSIGNSGASGAITVTLDTKPPVLTIGLTDPTDSISITVGSNKSLKQPFTVGVETGGTVANVTMTRIATLNWQGVFAPVVAGSAYNVTVTAADKAGNFATNTASFKLQQVSIAANTTTTVNSTDTQLAMQTTSNATVNGTISVTTSEGNPSGVVDHPAGSSDSAGIFVEINASPDLRDNINNQTVSLTIKVYYNATELQAQGLNPASIQLYFWDETQGVWSVVANTTLGQEPAPDSRTFILVPLNHLSKYGLFGTAISSVPIAAGGGSGNPTSGIAIGSGFTQVQLNIGQNGAVQTAVQLKSSDGKFMLDIPAFTILHDASGNALSTFSVSAVSSPPAAPSGSGVIFAYNFGPDGANFNPPITLTMNYDPAALPAGTNETQLYIAWWDGTQWQALTGTVDKVNHTVSVKVAHFTMYALLSKNPVPATPTPQVPTSPTPVVTPAKFAVASLSITPASVKAGEIVTVTATVTNSGGTQDKYTLTLKVNGVSDGTKDVTLAPGASEKVTFNVSQNLPGTYTIELGGLTGTFTVGEAPKPPETPANYTTLIIGLLVCAGIIAGVLAYFVWRRRRNQVS